MQRPHEDAVNDLCDAGVFGVGHEGARRRLAGGRRPRRAVIAWEGRDFGEARMVYAASDEGEVSLAGSSSSATMCCSSRRERAMPFRLAADRIRSCRQRGMTLFLCQDLTVEGGTSPNFAAIGRMPPNFWKTLCMAAL